MLSECVFYRPEHRANSGPQKLNFEGLGMHRLNKAMDRAQRIDEKLFICLVIMFTSGGMVIKMSNNGFLYFHKNK